MSQIQFVNIHGDFWSPSKRVIEKKPAEKRSYDEGFHKGFRVVGHPPGSLEKARKEREEEILNLTRKRHQGDACVKIPPQFNEDEWRRNGKKSSVRSKPYEIMEAANLCAELARKNGWTEVDVIELKKEGRQKD